MGKIELDHTGSGGGVTLSSDGTDLLLDGTAIGGGGGGGSALELYAENPSSPTAPSATGTNAVAIGDQSVSAGTRSIALGDSYASGLNSFALSIDNNTSSYGATANNSIAMGFQAKATSSNAVAIGRRAIASGFGGVAISTSGWSGSGASAEAQGTIAIGNQITTGTTGVYSICLGTDIANTQRDAINLGREIKNDTKGKFVWGNGQFSANGDSQEGRFILRSDTTDATSEALTTNKGIASTDNQIILPNNSAYAFHGTIVARQQASGGTASAAWKIEGLIRREGSAGTTVLVNSATTVLDNTPSWGMALSADTTNGGLKIEVTGAASTNIRWVATIHTSEVTYA